MRRPSAPASARRLAVLVVLLLGLAPLAALAAPADDAYIAGYAAAVLERQFNVSARSLEVKEGVLSLDAVDVPRPDRPTIIGALSSIRGVTRVELREPAPTPVAGAERPGAGPPVARFLPVGHLFTPLIADPRWPHFSAAYRYYVNHGNLGSVAAVSFGETLPIYRSRIDEDGRWGLWEAGLQAGVFSVLDLDSPSFDLLNTDFFIAAFGGYRVGNLSGIGRVFHQSSHLGDELLLRKTRPNRVNLSYEGFDARLSYDLPWGLRVYGGGGYLFDVDPSSLARGSTQAGVEFRSPRAFWQDTVRPIAGLDIHMREENDWHPDVSLRTGVQLESVALLGRNLQVLLEYFTGRSFDGQFYREPVDYVGLGVHFNF